MNESPDMDVTELLAQWRAGDTDALDRLLPLVYRELRAVAQGQMARENRRHTLQATALVHEVYLRLVGKEHPRWKDRSHFFAAAALLMRRVLTDHARKVGAMRRGGGVIKVSLDETTDLPSSSVDSLTALDDALFSLGEIDPRKARVVELHFYSGLTFEETAHALGVGRATAIRDWRFARSWLLNELQQASNGNPESVRA